MALRTAANVDNNQKKIVTALRRIGAKVLHTHQLKNCCDLMVGFRGKWYPMEIKDGSKLPRLFYRLGSIFDKEKILVGKLTEGERKFYEESKRLGLPYVIAYDVDSAFRGIGAHKPNFPTSNKI